MAILLEKGVRGLNPNCLPLPSTTVGEALELVDGLLANPERTFDDCVLAQAIADRLDNGETLVDCDAESVFVDGFESGDTTVWRTAGP